MKKTTIAVLGAVLTSALTAFGGRDNVLSDFPRLTGETDDAPRFQRAVDASAGGVLTVPGDDYTFARTVYVSNLCSIVMSPSARIKAVAEMDWMIKINALWQSRPKRAPKNLGFSTEMFNLTYRGGTLDANGLASCLAIDNYRHFTLENATFLNGRQYGVGIETEGGGYEMIARNLFIRTNISGLAGNVGLYTYGGDSHYTDIIVTDYTTGVHFAGRGANRLTRIHVWGGPVPPPKPGALPEMLKNSVCFRIDSSGEILRDCYADTGATGFWVNGWEVRMFGCSFFNNTGFNLKDITVVRQDKGSLWVSGALFNRQTPQTKLYVGSPEAKIRWMDDCILRFFDRNVDRTIPATKGGTVPPVNIDVGRQLFLDDSLLAENKAKRTWHKPTPGSGKSVTSARPGVVMDVDALDGYRYKSLANIGGGDVLELKKSKDGVDWTAPVKIPFDKDAVSVFYSPFKREWFYPVLSREKKDGHGLFLAYDSDFVAGAKRLPHMKPWLKNAKVSDSEEILGMDAVAYESVMIGLCTVSDKAGGPGASSLRFGFSRPHDMWRWTFPKMAGGGEFIAGSGRGRVLSGSGVCTVLDDEIRFHCNGGATLRRDGFCSLSDGTAVTKPLVFTKGDRLCLNVSAKQGSVTVVAEGLDGKVLGSCMIEGEDSVRREAFALRAGMPFRLRFSIAGKARLYSFWSADASGRSRGYLGGGSTVSKSGKDE